MEYMQVIQWNIKLPDENKHYEMSVWQVWYNRTVAYFIALFSDVISHEQTRTYNGAIGSGLESASEKGDQNLSPGTTLLCQSHKFTTDSLVQTKKHLEKENVQEKELKWP